MTCEHCGATLPATAMFCGECGNAVAPAPRAASPGAAATHDRATGARSSGAGSSGERTSGGGATDERGAGSSPTCSQCGATMNLTDIFCAECGHVAQAVAEAYLTQTRAVTVRTAPIVRTAGSAAEAAVRVRPTVTSAPAASGAPASVASAPPAPPAPSAPMRSQSASPEGPALASEPLPEDTESTRLVTRNAAGPRFVLQFSTGEQASVTGTGLLGRNPQVQPGERFEHLLTLHDPGRSVSKTHLEFGQEHGEFWVLDRFSGNGTVLRQPEQAPTRCEPGHRYRVTRGSRVDIGEQFFVVS